MNGKGDRNRTANQQRYRENYERIFGSSNSRKADRNNRTGSDGGNISVADDQTGDDADAD